MSNYLQNAIHPKTGNIETAEMLDDCFGHHGYGVLFKDGSLYYNREVELVSGNTSGTFDGFKSEAAYREGVRVMEARTKNTLK